MEAVNDLAAWLRPKIEADLREWRERKAHFQRTREREGDFHYFEARERVDRCRAELAIIREHEHARTRTGAYGTPFDFGCTQCHEMSDPDGNADVRPDGWCETLCLLGYGYRYRGGWRREWAPYVSPATGRVRPARR